MAKICHAFTAIPVGRGLLTPCNRTLQKTPSLVYLQRNSMLYTAITGCQTLLQESSDSPTQCCELVGGWSNYMSVCDASSHGVDGVIFGKNEACMPIRWEWSQDVKDLYQLKNITKSDLKMAGLLFLWLIMETVCDDLQEKRVALFSNNLPTEGWVRHLASRRSLVSAHLIHALALRLKLKGTCPITPLHITGKENLMTDILLHSFGSKPQWHCRSNHALLALFNNVFPLPNQTSWNVFQISYAVGMLVTSILQMRDFTLDEWRQLPKAGNLVGSIGQPMLRLWEWTLSYRTPRLQSESASSLGLPLESGWGTMVQENKSKLGVYLAQSRPLDRQLHWPQTPTPPN